MNVCWNITSKCNKNCNYCFKFNEPDLSLENNIKILHKLKDMGVVRIAWTGGEPYMYEDITTLIKLSHELGIKNYVNTNASFLTPENLDEKLKYLDRLIISVDFVDDSLNLENNIGKDYYKHVSELIPEINKRFPNLELQINTVVYRNNIDLIDDVYKEISKYPISRWKLIKFFPIRGKAYDEKIIYHISQEEFNKIKDRYKDTKNNFDIILHDNNDMSKNHYIIISSGSLISSEDTVDEIKIEKLYD